VPRVLLMEADGALAGRLRARLARDGIETTVAASAAEGLNLVAGDSFDLAAADDGLPDLDGARLVERLRRIRSGLPVMLLTSSAGPRRRIRYYRLGANDVMVKPFWPDEFAARVRNLLDLTGKAFIGPIRAGDLTIDPDRRTADMAGQPLALTPTEFDLFALFLRETRGGRSPGMKSWSASGDTPSPRAGRISWTSMSATCGRKSTGHSARSISIPCGGSDTGLQPARRARSVGKGKGGADGKKGGGWFRPRRPGPSQNPAGRHIPVAPVLFAQFRIRDADPGLISMNDEPVSGIDGDMVDARPFGRNVEEDEIALLQVFPGDEHRPRFRPAFR